MRNWVLVLACACLALASMESAIIPDMDEADMETMMNQPRPESLKRMRRPTRQSQERVLVGIMSAPRNFEKRSAIRESWMRYIKGAHLLPSVISPMDIQRTDVVFFVGEAGGMDGVKVEQEMEQEPDLVRLPLMESYHNLTLKTRMMLEYAHSSNYSVLFKVDDDGFTRLDLFLQFISSQDSTADLYWGRLKHNVPVIREASHKWYEGLFKGEVYPDYMLGSGYVVGKTVIDFVGENAETLPLYANEDASLGIWTQHLPLSRQRMPQMVLQPWCDDRAVIVNGVSTAEHAVLLNNLHATGSICSPSFTLQVCVDEPCQCCLSRDNMHEQRDELCCY